jgi:hypothetical protein
LDVLRGGEQQLRVVVEVANPNVAVVAEQTTHPVRHMAVVDVPELAATARTIGTADRTAPLLLEKHPIPVLFAQPIPAEGSTAFLGASFLWVAAIHLAGGTDRLPDTSHIR